MKIAMGKVWVWLKRGVAGGMLAVGGGALVLSVPLVANALVDRLQIFPALGAAEIDAAANGPPAAIVILAAGRRRYAPEFGGESLDAFSLERTRYGADLARQTGLPVLVSGGLGTKDRAPLALLLAETLAEDYGVKAKWQEARSENTAENAILSAEILGKAGISRILLVTHAWHMKRARAAFAANGIAVIAAPTAFYGRAQDSFPEGLIPSSSALRMSGYALHEIIGSQWYALRYGF